MQYPASYLYKVLWLEQNRNTAQTGGTIFLILQKVEWQIVASSYLRTPLKSRSNDHLLTQKQ